MDLVEQVYRVTENLPRHETYGLASQMQRAAVSIPANIAEGHERPGEKVYLHFLSVAQASMAELETHVEIAGRLQYLKRDDVSRLLEQCDFVGRQLRALRKSLLQRPGPPVPSTLYPVPNLPNTETTRRSR
jgi:four helix bundle protein